MTQQRTDTTVKIFEYLYRCRIPWLQSQPVEVLRRYGVTLSGIQSVDNDIHNQWITTMLTIAQMAELFKEGVSIKVCNYSDTKEIYEAISHHIYAWKQQLERGINIGNAPIDDLITLDQLANTVYDHAKYQFTKEMADSIIARHLTDVQRINAHNFFKPSLAASLYGSNQTGDGVTTINPIKDNQPPERESLHDFFRDRLISLRRY